MTINDHTEMIPAYSLPLIGHDQDPTIEIPAISKQSNEPSRQVQDDQGLLWVPMLIFVIAVLIWVGIVWYGLENINGVLYTLVLWDR